MWHGHTAHCVRKKGGETHTKLLACFGGEVLEVLCSGASKKYRKLRSVKTGKPVTKAETSSHPHHEEWITPKVYKGTSDREYGLLTWIRKLFS